MMTLPAIIPDRFPTINAKSESQPTFRGADFKDDVRLSEAGVLLAVQP
jgi:hypothetical protein